MKTKWKFGASFNLYLNEEEIGGTEDQTQLDFVSDDINKLLKRIVEEGTVYTEVHDWLHDDNMFHIGGDKAKKVMGVIVRPEEGQEPEEAEIVGVVFQKVELNVTVIE